MTFQDAYKIVSEAMPAYNIISASEIEAGWLFSFAAKDGSSLDAPPLLVSRSDGSMQPYSMGEHFIEVLYAEPIPLSELEL